MNWILSSSLANMKIDSQTKLEKYCWLEIERERADRRRALKRPTQLGALKA